MPLTLLSALAGLLLSGRMTVMLPVETLQRVNAQVPLEEVVSASHYVYTANLAGAAAPVSAVEQLADEQMDAPTMRGCGFNTIWLVEFRSKLESPGGLANLRAELDNARANHLNVILGLNYGAGFQIPRDPSNPSFARAFGGWVRFVSGLLAALDDYRDIVRPVVFAEGQAAPDLANAAGDVVAARMRVTIGNLPGLLDPALRERWTFGWYGGWTTAVCPSAPAQGYDWYAFSDYFFDPSIRLTWPQKGLSDEQIQQTLDRDFRRVRALFPGQTYFFAEGGYYTCDSATLDRAGQVYGLIASWCRTNGIGFNLWGWRTKYTPEQECNLRGGKGGHSLTNPDGSGRPALYDVERAVSK